MGHRTHRNPVTVTRRAASRVQARACVVSLAPVLAVLVALTAGGLGAAHIAPAQVARVVDGDTISVRLADGARDTVRLTGVDTPETVHPTRGVEPHGPEAAAYTRARLAGATVWLVADPAGDHQDRAAGRGAAVTVPQDRAEAARWFRRAADQGDGTARLFLTHMDRTHQLPAP